MNGDNKNLVLEFFKGIQTGTPDPLSFIGPQKYIQHNLSAPDGVAGFAGMLAHLPKGTISAKVKRIFEDGDFVFTHSDYEFFGTKVGFDIFRFEGNKIVEHWDNLQVLSGPNLSGHTMTDGPTTSEEPEKTETNKALIKNFADNVLVGSQIDKLAQYVSANLIQHNPQVPDSLAGLIASLKGLSMRYTRVHKILGEGNFVLAVCDGIIGDSHVSIYDLFRLKNDKIVEHWDVWETILPKGEWKNNNGKFGF